MTNQTRDKSNQTRDRIAAAFERELAKTPVPQGLRAQVLRENVRGERDREAPKSHSDGRPWIAGLRGVGSLVAVALVVVLVATVLAGGRVWHDWNQFNTRPATVGGIDPAQLALLRARPLNLPVVQPGATCPMGPQTTIEYGGGPYDLYGSGPVYAIDSAGSWIGTTAPAFFVTAWGGYWGMKVFVPPSVTGPVLIRARNLQADQALVYVGQFASGTVVGSDSIGGKQFQQHLEAALDLSQPPFDMTPSGLRIWKIIVGQSRLDQPNLCAGFQIDGLNFSEVFVSYYRG